LRATGFHALFMTCSNRLELFRVLSIKRPGIRERFGSLRNMNRTPHHHQLRDVARGGNSGSAHITRIGQQVGGGDLKTGVPSCTTARNEMLVEVRAAVTVVAVFGRAAAVPAPEEAEACAVPADKRSGFHGNVPDGQRFQTGQKPSPPQSVCGRQFGRCYRALKDTDLMALGEDLELEQRPAPKRGHQRGNEGGPHVPAGK
jgi:hypothetical protein